MSLVSVLPLLLVALIGLLVVVARLSSRVERAVSLLALMTFGSYVNRGESPESRERALHAAFIDTPYRVYQAKSLLYSTLAAVAGTIVGMYVGVDLLRNLPAVLNRLEAIAPIPITLVASIPTFTSFDPVDLFGLLLLSGGTLGLGSWLLVYRLRWWLPDQRAETRAHLIELSMPRVIAFMYALSRGGLEIAELLAIIRQHRHEFGEASRELSVSGKAIDHFGMDSISAVRHVARRTPSDQFRIFMENFASVLQSSRNLSTFLGERYEQYQEEAEKQQAHFLDRLGAIAEGYVALVVIGPLFLITVLLVFGLISGGTDTAMAFVIYFVIPALNIGFIEYLDRVTKPHDPNASNARHGNRSVTNRDGAEAGDMAHPRPVTDGGIMDERLAREQANRERLAIYDRLHSFFSFMSAPLVSIRNRPVRILYLSIPLAVLWFVGHLYGSAVEGPLTIRIIDDIVVISVLIAMIPYAITRRVHIRRLRAIDQVVPDLLNRLASLNEAGIEVVTTFREVRSGDLGMLSPEIRRVWTDIEYGLDVETALHRMEARVPSPSVSRAITLITNGMKSSGNIGPVLRIAADESRRLRTLRQNRRQEMSIYLVITYLSFFVFLTIVFVLMETFIPAIPSAEVIEGQGLGGTTAGITQAQVSVYTMLLFHASLIHGFFSGLVSGQMSQGSLRDGTIHISILLIFAYILFTVVT